MTSPRRPSRVHVGSVVHDVVDMQRAMDFWAATLGYVADLHEGGDFCILRDPDKRYANVSLQLAVRGKREPNRVHLDLYTEDMAGEVERLTALGATAGPDGWSNDDHTVLRDPDGNEFCVCRSFLP